MMIDSYLIEASKDFTLSSLQYGENKEDNSCFAFYDKTKNELDLWNERDISHKIQMDKYKSVQDAITSENKLISEAHTRSRIKDILSDVKEVASMDVATKGSQYLTSVKVVADRDADSEALRINKQNILKNAELALLEKSTWLNSAAPEVLIYAITSQKPSVDDEVDKKQANEEPAKDTKDGKKPNGEESKEEKTLGDKMESRYKTQLGKDTFNILKETKSEVGIRSLMTQEGRKIAMINIGDKLLKSAAMQINTQKEFFNELKQSTTTLLDNNPKLVNKFKESAPGGEISRRLASIAEATKAEGNLNPQKLMSAVTKQVDPQLVDKIKGILSSKGIDVKESLAKLASDPKVADTFKEGGPVKSVLKEVASPDGNMSKTGINAIKDMAGKAGTLSNLKKLASVASLAAACTPVGAVVWVAKQLILDAVIDKGMEMFQDSELGNKAMNIAMDTKDSVFAQLSNSQGDMVEGVASVLPSGMSYAMKPAMELVRGNA